MQDQCANEIGLPDCMQAHNGLCHLAVMLLNGKVQEAPFRKLCSRNQAAVAA